MILNKLRIMNYRSIVDTGTFPVTRLLALVGENNCGKSNILSATEKLLAAGTAGTIRADFNNPESPIVITGTFSDLLPEERKRWQSYIVNGELILEKQFVLQADARSGKEKVEAEFHGYRAEPRDWFLSPAKIAGQHGERPNWKKIAEDNGLPPYFIEDGKCNKTLFTKGLSRYLEENEVPHDPADLSSTQALGLQSNVVASLPRIYFLSAITDYADETDRRSSTSTFRRLMGDLSERILRADPDYIKIDAALAELKGLLNSIATPAGTTRLNALTAIEARITDILKKLMPTVSGVSLAVEVDDLKSIFANGISLAVNDGLATDVLAKGHGLQRCVVFSLLQALIMNERNQLLAAPAAGAPPAPPILLVIEEPELYIHPQLAKLFFDVMRRFAEIDQVLYATHSPLFIDAFEYSNVATVRKDSVASGTKVTTADPTAFADLDDRKVFKGFTRLNPAVNELFFAKRVLIVEGPEDQIGVVSYLINEGRIINRVEELDWSIIVAGGKDSIPFFQRVLKAFAIPYIVLHDIDITPGMAADDRAKHERTNSTIAALAGTNRVVTFPVKMELSLNLTEHLKDQYRAHEFFSDPANISQQFKDVVAKCFA